MNLCFLVCFRLMICTILPVKSRSLIVMCKVHMTFFLFRRDCFLFVKAYLAIDNCQFITITKVEPEFIPLIVFVQIFGVDNNKFSHSNCFCFFFRTWSIGNFRSRFKSCNGMSVNADSNPSFRLWRKFVISAKCCGCS